MHDEIHQSDTCIRNQYGKTTRFGEAEWALLPVRESSQRHSKRTRKALGTENFKEACRIVAYERMHWLTVFDEVRRKLPGQKQRDSKAERKIVVLTEREAHEHAARFLIRLEKQFRGWWEDKGWQLSADEKFKAALNVSDEIEAFSRDSVHGVGLHGEGIRAGSESAARQVDDHMAQEGCECPANSPAFRILRPLFRAAQEEHAWRKLDKLGGKAFEVRDPQFREIFAGATMPETKPSMSVAGLLERYSKHLEASDKSESTHRAYVLPFRLLRECLGENRELCQIDKDVMETVCDIIRNLPLNAAQRYPRLSLPDAVKEADAKGDKRRLKNKTQKGYFEALVAIFNFAVGKGYMKDNPIKDRYLRQSFGKEERVVKTQFTIDELNTLFRAPLYTGCLNDFAGFAIKGEDKPRRGRFWVPLLALFHGLRCNEACQLYTEDVKTQGDIPFLAIRELREDGSKCDKRLKTGQSNREVPLHPKILELGFLDFVEERRKDSESPRLFPELICGNTGYFSNPFSKYFGRFLESCLVDTKATFHSFRHHFRDACRAARLPTETVALLAGWEHGQGAGEAVMNRYGRGMEFFKVLAADLAKVEYPGLDISHLRPDLKPAFGV